MTASASTDRLADLLNSGFQVSDVSSTEEHVIVQMAKIDHAITLQFDVDDARALLQLEEAKTTKRVPTSV